MLQKVCVFAKINIIINQIFFLFLGSSGNSSADSIDSSSSSKNARNYPHEYSPDTGASGSQVSNAAHSTVSNSIQGQGGHANVYPQGAAMRTQVKLMGCNLWGQTFGGKPLGQTFGGKPLGQTFGANLRGKPSGANLQGQTFGANLWAIFVWYSTILYTYCHFNFFHLHLFRLH